MNAISLAKGAGFRLAIANALDRLRIAFQPSGLGGPAGGLHVLAVGFQRTEESWLADWQGIRHVHPPPTGKG
jgi:hypothetical protein